MCIRARPRTGGEVLLNGKPLNCRTPHDAIANGVVMVPEDRKLQGIIPRMSVGKNIYIGSLDQITNRLGIVNTRREEQIGLDGKANFNIKTPNLEKPIVELSGGNQQKAIVARWMSTKPEVLILDEPTNHLDMRSKDVLKEAIREFDGTVILVSHDRDFLDGLATKVYEFGGGLVKEHLGGIYEFLQKKKIDSLNELQKGAGLSASPTASAKGNEPETVQPSENKLSYEAQKELNKKIKKLERQVADCEASIEETESAIAIVEAKMATPEGASDMQLYERHQKLKQQLDGIVEEWERVSMELEETKN